MKTDGTAFFVETPQMIDDLWVPHLVERERPYEVAKQLRLSKIEYENFVTDLLADRQFIEDNADLCSEGEVWRCLLVQQRGRADDGVLVMPAEDKCHVKWAAYYAEY